MWQRDDSVLMPYLALSATAPEYLFTVKSNRLGLDELLGEIFAPVFSFRAVKLERTLTGEKQYGRSSAKAAICAFSRGGSRSKTGAPARARAKVCAKIWRSRSRSNGKNGARARASAQTALKGKRRF